jgi:hypothetical protein
VRLEDFIEVEHRQPSVRALFRPFGPATGNGSAWVALTVLECEPHPEDVKGA